MNFLFLEKCTVYEFPMCMFPNVCTVIIVRDCIIRFESDPLGYRHASNCPHWTYMQADQRVKRQRDEGG